MIDVKEMQRNVDGIIQDSSKALEKIREGKLKKTKQLLQDASTHLSDLETSTQRIDLSLQINQMREYLKKALTLYDQAATDEEQKPRYLALMRGYCQRIVKNSQEIHKMISNKPWLNPDNPKEITNKPWNIVKSAEVMAKVKEITKEEVIKITENNTKKFFNLPI